MTVIEIRLEEAHADSANRGILTMRIDIITLFPELCEAVMGESIVGRARKKGAIEVYCHQLREYTYDKHNRVDDTPYGGGMGMLLMAEPIADCFEHVCELAAGGLI